MDDLQKLLDAATPGPWVVPDQTYSRTLTVETGGGLDSVIIQCPGSGGAMSYTDTVCELAWNNTPEWDANASLIALAPTLARQVIAAQKLVEALEVLARGDDSPDGMAGDIARSALAEWEAAQ